MRTKTPQAYADQAESALTLPPGTEERFAGYALMGIPFSTGNYLAFRRFPASSIGPGYHAVWLRRPDHRWTVFADAAPELSCARYFGAALKVTSYAHITADWTGPSSLQVTVPGVLDWRLELKATWTTAVITEMARRLPAAWWRREQVLRAMGTMIGPVLHVGTMNFTGRVPNGQSFQAQPLRVWAVSATQATIDGEDAGTPQPFPEQDHLADFWLPQHGLFVADLSIRFPSTAPVADPAPISTTTKGSPS